MGEDMQEEEVETVEQEPQAEEGGAEGQTEELDLRAALEQERMEKAYYRGLAEANRTPKKQEEEFDINSIPDDHYLTKKELKAYLDKIEGSFSTRQAKLIEQDSERRAEQTYPDYYDVVTLYTTALCRSNPSLFKLIKESNDPAETAYLIGKTHPSLRTQTASANNGAMVNKINKNLQKPGTLSSAPSKRQTEDERIASLEGEDLEKEIERVLGHRR
jgi:hypothetical protein